MSWPRVKVGIQDEGSLIYKDSYLRITPPAFPPLEPFARNVHGLKSGVKDPALGAN